MDDELAQEQRMGSLPQRDALGHYLPGQSGNRSGRTPDKYTLGGTVRAMLKEPEDPEKPDGPTKAEALAQQMYKDAMAGDTKAGIALGERAEGKPAQAVTLSLDGANPLHHQLPVRTTGARRSAASDALLEEPQPSGMPGITDSHARDYEEAEYAELPPEPDSR